MRTTLQTAANRLDGLLPWLNGHSETDAAAIRRSITAFVESFDGSAGAGFLDTTDWDWPDRPAFIPRATWAATLAEVDLGELHLMLRLLLERGFGDLEWQAGSWPATSLRFAVRWSGRQKPKKRVTADGNLVVVGGVKALRAYHAAGAYILQVQGIAMELVPFLVAHLLMQPDMVRVHRCPAPGCGNFFVLGRARERPKIFCSIPCQRWNAAQRHKPTKGRKT